VGGKKRPPGNQVRDLFKGGGFFTPGEKRTLSPQMKPVQIFKKSQMGNHEKFQRCHRRRVIRKNHQGKPATNFSRRRKIEKQGRILGPPGTKRFSGPQSVKKISGKRPRDRKVTYVGGTQVSTGQ